MTRSHHEPDAVLMHFGEGFTTKRIPFAHVLRERNVRRQAALVIHESSLYNSRERQLQKTLCLLGKKRKVIIEVKFGEISYCKYCVLHDSTSPFPPLQLQQEANINSLQSHTSTQQTELQQAVFLSKQTRKKILRRTLHSHILHPRLNWVNLGCFRNIISFRMILHFYLFKPLLLCSFTRELQNISTEGSFLQQSGNTLTSEVEKNSPRNRIKTHIWTPTQRTNSHNAANKHCVLQYLGCIVNSRNRCRAKSANLLRALYLIKARRYRQ